MSFSARPRRAARPARPGAATHPARAAGAPPRGLPAASRRGVALVLALGVLSLLLLLVAAFVIAMRVEHLAARHARDKTRARQYLRAALALGTETVSRQLAGRLAPANDWHWGAEPDEPPEDTSETGRLLARLRPDWTQRVPSGDGHWLAVLASPGYHVPGIDTLFTGDVTNLVPPSLREQAGAVVPGWTYIISTNILGGAELTLAGRVSWLAIDAGGLLDVHTLSTNQYLAAAQVGDFEAFFEDREAHRRYEHIGDLFSNRGLFDLSGDPAHDTVGGVFESFLDALGTESYDPDPHQLAHASWMGDRGAVALTNRLDLNSITNAFGGLPPDAAAGATPSTFYRDLPDPGGYFLAISNTLFHAQSELDHDDARALYWNLLNYLDTDRIRQTDTDHPWLDSYGIEAVPLVNELLLAEADDSIPEHPKYGLAVELWYPFAPADSPANTTLQAAMVAHTQPLGEGGIAANDEPPDEPADGDPAPPDRFLDAVLHSRPWAVADGRAVGFTNAVPVLRYPETQFHVAETPVPFDFPVVFTNALGQLETVYLPLGEAEYVSHVPVMDEGVQSWWPVRLRVLNTMAFCVRVAVGGHIVDEAPGPRRETQPLPAPWFVTVQGPFAASVADPRWNSRVEYWREKPPTPGALNEGFNEDAEAFQGLPVFVRDGLPEALGEIGYLGTATPWRSLDLLDGPGARLLDLWTVRRPSDDPPSRGRIHAQTAHPAAVRALLAETRFGMDRFDADPDRPHFMVTEAGQSLLDALTNAFITASAGLAPVPGPADAPIPSLTLPFHAWLPALGEALETVWTDQFGAPEDGEGDGAPEAAPGYGLPGRDRFEDLFRDLPEHVSFRRNVLLFVLRSQTLAPNGRVTADSAAAVLTVRDAYTGVWSHRWWLPLH